MCTDLNNGEGSSDIENQEGEDEGEEEKEVPSENGVEEDCTVPQVIPNRK